jgi:plasmid stabilization system protein ParE
MSRYVLTSSAVEDLRQIMAYLATEASEEIAQRIEQKLFACFEDLATNPGLGHRRSDLTERPVVFFPVYPYLVIYQRDVSPIVIHAILHGARDVKQMFEIRQI